MTEVDWLTGTDFETHLRFAADHLSPRRQRLLAAGFCRVVAPLFDHPELNAALVCVESFADGRASVSDLEKARLQCRVVAQQAHDAYVRRVDDNGNGAARDVRDQLAWAVACAASRPLTPADVGNRVAAAAVQARTGTDIVVSGPSAVIADALAEQMQVMLSVVREVVGNPFRPVQFAGWRTDTAVSLARQMYDAREFGAMPILADALQDAGCENVAVLTHCRDAHDHVRGCWVVDGVLGLA